MTQSKKGPIRKKKSQNQVKPTEGVASSNGVEHVAEAQEPKVNGAPISEVLKEEASKEVAEAPIVEEMSKPVESTYIRILGFEFESTITKDEEVLLNKAVESGDLSHISKQLLFKGIQELGHIIEKQRSVYDRSLASVRESAAELRRTATDSDKKLSELDATVLTQQNSIRALEEENEAFEDRVKDLKFISAKKEEEIQSLQKRLESEIVNSADITIKLGTLKEKVWKFVNLGWFTRLTTNVDTFFYGK